MVSMSKSNVSYTHLKFFLSIVPNTLTITVSEYLCFLSFFDIVLCFRDYIALLTQFCNRLEYLHLFLSIFTDFGQNFYTILYLTLKILIVINIL